MTAILGSYGCKKSKIALVSVAPAGTGYEVAVISYTLVRAGSAPIPRARYLS